MVWTALALLGAFIWLIVFFLPWRPWSTREFLDAHLPNEDFDLKDVCVLIPARNEEKEIARTLQSLKTQGRNLRVILVNDLSTDQTVKVARESFGEGLEILEGQTLPEGWAGKLWALEQGRQKVDRKLVLLMDADIELKPGILAELVQKLHRDQLGFVSLMAALKMESFWEKLLVPAYIYFFKLLFPFKLGNSKSPAFAVAAGGCILVKAEALKEIGGFKALQNALIDDCTLAGKIKRAGYRTWTGLTHSVTSHRDYSQLSEVWNLVARFAFTYLRYSNALLLVCTILLIACFWALPTSLIFQSHSFETMLVLTAGFLAMIGVYIPTLKFYGLSWIWALLKPVSGTLYLMMTWTSAIRYWRGTRSEWKGRTYDQNLKSSEDVRKAS